MSIDATPSMCPFSSQMINDPHSQYEATRPLGPVVKVRDTARDWMIADSDSPIYLITGYRETSYVLESPDVFPSGDKTGPPEPPEVQKILAKGIPKTTTLYAADGDEHRYLRDIVQPTLSSAQVKRWESNITGWANTVGTTLPLDADVEIVEQFCEPFSSHAMLDYLGIPEADHATVNAWDKLWMKVFIPGYSLNEQCSAAEHIVDYQWYIASLVETAREGPPDNTIISRLSLARRGHDYALSVPQIVSTVSELYAAGYGNTKEALSNLLYLTLSNGLWTSLVEEPELIEGAVDEALRVEGPVQWLSREAGQDVTLGGVDIPAGATVVVSYIAANRDTAAFPDSTDVDFERSGVSRFGTLHLAHGRGPHFCVGAVWSKAAMRGGLEYLVTNYPELALSADYNSPEFDAPAPMLRYVKQVPVRVKGLDG